MYPRLVGVYSVAFDLRSPIFLWQTDLVVCASSENINVRIHNCSGTANKYYAVGRTRLHHFYLFILISFIFCCIFILLFTFSFTYVDLFLPCNWNAQTFKFRRQRSSNGLVARRTHTLVGSVCVTQLSRLDDWCCCCSCCCCDSSCDIKCVIDVNRSPQLSTAATPAAASRRRLSKSADLLVLFLHHVRRAL